MRRAARANRIKRDRQRGPLKVVAIEGYRKDTEKKLAKAKAAAAKP